MLVSARADIKANNEMGATPYIFAVMFGRYEVANFLESKSIKSGILQKF